MANDEQGWVGFEETVEPSAFVTGWPAGREVQIEIPVERADTTLDGPWLDDPSYAVGEFLLGLTAAR